MKKEFNLKEKRVKLFDLFMTTGMTCDAYFERLKEQDKEFIKRLKGALYLRPISKEDFNKEIDKLSGGL